MYPTKQPGYSTTLQSRVTKSWYPVSSFHIQFRSIYPQLTVTLIVLTSNKLVCFLVYLKYPTIEEHLEYPVQETGNIRTFATLKVTFFFSLIINSFIFFLKNKFMQPVIILIQLQKCQVSCSSFSILNLYLSII